MPQLRKMHGSDCMHSCGAQTQLIVCTLRLFAVNSEHLQLFRFRRIVESVTDYDLKANGLHSGASTLFE